jgi:hypothetical protein
MSGVKKKRDIRLNRSRHPSTDSEASVACTSTSSSISSIFAFMFVSLIRMQAPCQKARLTREKCSSPRKHCSNTDAGAGCQVIAEQPTMVSRLSFGNEVAIRSKPLALIRRVAPYVRDRPRDTGFDGLKSTSDDVPHFSVRIRPAMIRES